MKVFNSSLHFVEMSLPVQTRIDFIENLVILSFGDPPPFVNPSNDDYKMPRIGWIRTEMNSVFPNHSDPEKERLMLLCNTIPTMEKAEEKLAEARAERQYLLQQGDLIVFHSFSSHFLNICLFYIFYFWSSTSTSQREQ